MAIVKKIFPCAISAIQRLDMFSAVENPEPINLTPNNQDSSDSDGSDSDMPYSNNSPDKQGDKIMRKFILNAPKATSASADLLKSINSLKHMS